VDIDLIVLISINIAPTLQEDSVLPRLQPSQRDRAAQDGARVCNRPYLLTLGQPASMPDIALPDDGCLSHQLVILSSLLIVMVHLLWVT
jgi:hypothetical protein